MKGARYNVTASDEDRFVWFRVAKVGTRTILDILKKHSRLSMVHASDVRYDHRLYRNYFKFAFVRNPWDRVVSCFEDKVSGPKTMPFYKECAGKDFGHFVRFIEGKDLTKSDRHIMPQSRLFPVNGVDFIGHFENFSPDLKFVLNKIGINVKDIPVKNKSDRKADYRDYYDKETREIIRKKYADDIAAFKYSF